ncbi:MAG: S41 family peptidase [Oscillospiraceae bacterium]|nr:S41 family peptidase [Oscillospiraceae bacterium]
MGKKVSLGATVALMLMAAAIAVTTTFIYSQSQFNGKMVNLTEREAMYSKLSELDRIARNNYIGEVDEENLNDYIARGYIAGLGDKYARYFDAESYKVYTQELEGRVVGIGVEAKLDPSGYILIDTVYDDSPAAINGLLPGDLIVKVDEIDVNADTYNQAVEGIRGEEGTRVTLTVRRDNEDTEIPVTRRKVNIPTVFSRLIDGNVAYIRISEFSDSTAEQFSRQVDDLIASGAQALIFDVRNNGGGTLTSVSAMLDKLLPRGTIVSATYKSGKTEVLATSDAGEILLPMAVLTNSKTASAAELFTQALKDYEKAKSVGSTTFGKGSMQEVKKLNDGSAVNLTVATYFPPSGVSYDGVGIKPDYEVQILAELENNLENLNENTDPQLKKALEVVLTAVRAESNSSGASEEESSSSASGSESSSSAASGESSPAE